MFIRLKFIIEFLFVSFSFRSFKLVRMASTQDAEGGITIPLQYNDAVSINILLIADNFIHFLRTFKGRNFWAVNFFLCFSHSIHHPSV